METIFKPTVCGQRTRRSRPFCKGCCISNDAYPAARKVIDYNCRFGDRDQVVLLPLLSDLLAVMGATNGTPLAQTESKGVAAKRRVRE